MSKKLIALPRKLADVLDTYYQTSAFAQKNFTKFSRDSLLNMVKDRAARLGYSMTAGEGKNAGQFEFSRPTQTIRVNRQSFPLAEVRV